MSDAVFNAAFIPIARDRGLDDTSFNVPSAAGCSMSRTIGTLAPPKSLKEFEAK